jgi:hypothetical protein
MACYEYAGLLSEVGAAWVSAIGTVVAIGVTTVFYVNDKRQASEQREREKAEEITRRSIDAGVRARLLLPALRLAQRSLQVMRENMSSGGSMYHADAGRIAGLEDLVESLDQLNHFEASLANDLAEFIAYGQNLRERMLNGLRFWDPEAVELVQQLEIRAESAMSGLVKLTQPS